MDSYAESACLLLLMSLHNRCCEDACDYRHSTNIKAQRLVQGLTGTTGPWSGRMESPWPLARLRLDLYRLQVCLAIYVDDKFKVDGPLPQVHFPFIM